MEKVLAGVLGGSGFYQLDGLENKKEVNLKTPFGDPSAHFVIGDLKGRKVAFLARHGTDHTILPHEINYQANIYAFKTLGVKYLLAPTAVGSLKENIKPLDFVITDQFFDRTKARKSTFFGDGIAVHIPFADPICLTLSDLIYRKAVEILENDIHKGGTYVCMEGPQFSTRAESEVYRKLGFDIIGMTSLQEAKLAREAEICYSNIALVTDYDCWFDEEVSLEQVLSNMGKNTENVKNLITQVIANLPEDNGCACTTALASSIVTAAENIPDTTKEALKPIIGKYIK